MKLFIEEWMENNKLSEGVSDIFKDAVLCYKNGIYTASLMMTYTAFLMLLKERLMNSSGPSIYPTQEWTKILLDIQDDDIWEKRVFELTQQVEKNKAGVVTHQSVFSIKQGVRDQLKYWKDRRNDCAHNKRNSIAHYHVESFWAFICSNSSRITVEGGKDALLNRIRDNYNISLTPKGIDITPLVEEIEYSVDVNELGDFWKASFLCIDEYYTLMPDEKIFHFIDKVLTISDSSVKNSLIRFIKSDDPDLLLSYIEEKPQRIIYLDLNVQEVRRLWHDELIFNINRLSIFAFMLNIRLIPSEQEVEAIDRIIISFVDNAKYNIQPELNYILTEHGFTQRFEDKYFTEEAFKKYNDTNDRSNFLGDFLDVNGFNFNTVKLLCYEYGKTYHSEFLFNYIKQIFIKRPERKTEFKKIAEDSNIEIPIKLADILV